MSHLISGDQPVTLDVQLPGRRAVALTDLQIRRIDGGLRVHSTDQFHVDILAMLGGNLRLVTTPVDHPLGYTRAWCYQRPITEVVLAAAAFNPDGDDEPTGWIKHVGTERRACAWLRYSRLQTHTGYDPNCPDCGDERLA